MKTGWHLAVLAGLMALTSNASALTWTTPARNGVFAWNTQSTDVTFQDGYFRANALAQTQWLVNPQIDATNVAYSGKFYGIATGQTGTGSWIQGSLVAYNYWGTFWGRGAVATCSGVGGYQFCANSMGSVVVPDGGNLQVQLTLFSDPGNGHYAKLTSVEISR